MSAQLKKKSVSGSTTITVRLPLSVAEDLDELVGLTARSKSYLASKAIEAYVNRELEICRAIQEGVDDIEAGRVVSHEEALKRLSLAAKGQ